VQDADAEGAVPDVATDHEEALMCLINRTQRIHWQLVIAQIRASGKGRSYRQMATTTGIPFTTLRSLSIAGQPTHSNGEVIIRYWCDRMGLMRDCLPKVYEGSNETALSDDQSQVA
jgi:hypothetical protein